MAQSKEEKHEIPAAAKVREKGPSHVDNDQNWYRQLSALVLLSSARAAVEYLTNPSSRENATNQLKSAFSEIDYNALANAMTRAIDQAAETSKSRLDDTIDALRSKGVDAVEDAKERAESKLVQKKGGKKMRFLFGLMLGGLIAYFVMDEQRRDDLLDRLTGASGPIEAYQPRPSAVPPPPPPAAPPPPPTKVTNTTEKTADQATQSVSNVAQDVAKKAEKATGQSDEASEKKQV